nr:hypothetical protein [Paenibacillus sacheonensis]
MGIETTLVRHCRQYYSHYVCNHSTLQNFPSYGRVYAAYGGVFVVLTVLWGWLVDKMTFENVYVGRRLDFHYRCFCNALARPTCTDNFNVLSLRLSNSQLIIYAFALFSSVLPGIFSFHTSSRPFN